MMPVFKILSRVAFAALAFPSVGAYAADLTFIGTVLAPTGIIADGAVSISGGTITAVGPSASIADASKAIKVPGIILPGFIDLHNHLTWNVFPRWIPARKFNNRYEWQDTAEYDRLLSLPHFAAVKAVACEIEIYAEIKALAGGATSVIGSLLKDPQYPDNAKCVAGLARNLDTDSGLLSPPAAGDTICPTKPDTDRTLLDAVDNEVFPLELPHDRLDYLLCELGVGTLRGLVIHLSEGATVDSSAHREYSMLSKEVLLKKDGKTSLPRDGLIIIHGTALRYQDFLGMKNSGVGLVWSPRSNDELYGSTTNIEAAHEAHIDIAIAPDWSPSGSAGMLQEIGYAARHYPTVTSSDLLSMATAVPAKIARLSDHVGALAPQKAADFIVISAKIDPASPTPLDPVVKATPADIALVVVGGQPLYGDPDLLKSLWPEDATLDDITVCGTPKKVYLGQSGAAARGQNLDQITEVLNTALARTGSHLPDIECD